MMQLIINRKTPSINHIYLRKGYHSFITKEGREIEKYIIEEINKQVSSNNYPIAKFKNVKLSLSIEIYEDWHTKKGEVARKDISNREKFLVDCIFKALDLDDKFIFEHRMKKIQSPQEKAVIMIERML